jgi:hypothetical protein
VLAGFGVGLDFDELTSRTTLPSGRRSPPEPVFTGLGAGFDVAPTTRPSASLIGPSFGGRDGADCERLVITLPFASLTGPVGPDLVVAGVDLTLPAVLDTVGRPTADNLFCAALPWILAAFVLVDGFCLTAEEEELAMLGGRLFGTERAPVDDASFGPLETEETPSCLGLGSC